MVFKQVSCLASNPHRGALPIQRPDSIRLYSAVVTSSSVVDPSWVGEHTDLDLSETAAIVYTSSRRLETHSMVTHRLYEVG